MGMRSPYSLRRCTFCGALAATMTFEALMNRWHCSDTELCSLTLIYEHMLKGVQSA